MPVNKLCIVRLSALGDVVLLLPLLRTLQTYSPSTQITWITSHAAYSILQGIEGVDFIVIDKPNSLRDYWHFYQRMRTHEFDVLLACQASLRANLLYPFIKASRKIGFDKARSKDGHAWFVNESIRAREEHLVEGFLGFAQTLGINDVDCRWDLSIDAADQAWAEQHCPGSHWVAINPAASKAERNWLPERYAAVIDYCQKQGMNVVITGGPGANEAALADTILRHCKVNSTLVNLVGKTSAKQCAAVLQKTIVLISPDTGPAHIAAAVGTPVIGLYAVAPAKLSAPYTSQDLVIDKFTAAAKAFLSNKDVPWGTRVHDPRAMALISVDDVKHKLKPLLGCAK